MSIPKWTIKETDQNVIWQNQEKHLLCVLQVSQKVPEAYFLEITCYYYPYTIY